MTHITIKKIGNNYYEYEQESYRGSDGKPHTRHVRYVGKAGLNTAASAPRGSQTPMTERENKKYMQLIHKKQREERWKLKMRDKQIDNDWHSLSNKEKAKYHNSSKDYRYERLHQAKQNRAADSKFHKVMREYGKGELKSSSGQKVTNQKQAEAIAFSEARNKYANYGK